MSSNTVWIIDDCTLARKLAVRAISDWTVREFTSGIDALTAFAEETEPPMAILIDEQMPGLQGTVVARAMRDSGYTGVTILLSGTVDDALRRCASASGIACVAQKPIDREAVGAVLDAAHRRRVNASA
jgi:FixJ family two-component response regulator